MVRKGLAPGNRPAHSQASRQQAARKRSDAFASIDAFAFVTSADSGLNCERCRWICTSSFQNVIHIDQFSAPMERSAVNAPE